MRTRGRVKVTALTDAISKENISLVKTLIKNGASLNGHDIDGYTPLFVAVRGGNLNISKVLLDSGADINTKCTNGYAPLHYACCYGPLDLVELLLDGNVNLNICNTGGETPLMLAAELNQQDILKALITAGADIFAKNKCGLSALSIAIQNRHLEIAKGLLRAGSLLYLYGTPEKLKVAEYFLNSMRAFIDFISTIRVEDENILLLLRISAKAGRLDTLKVFLKAGADIIVNNKLLNELLIFAVQGNNRNVAKYLIRYKLLLNSNSDLPFDHDNDLTEYWNHCRSQVSEMQKTMLGRSSISLYYFLREIDDTKLNGYLSNEETDLRRDLECSNYSEKFSAFADMIEEQHEIGKRRQCLVIKANIVMEHSDLKKLGIDILYNIVKFFKNVDLEALVRSAVYEQPKRIIDHPPKFISRKRRYEEI